jgi:hypothetical protein
LDGFWTVTGYDRERPSSILIDRNLNQTLKYRITGFYWTILVTVARIWIATGNLVYRNMRENKGKFS